MTQATTQQMLPPDAVREEIIRRGVATVVPSFIGTAARGELARTAYASFIAQVGDRHPFYVVDDTPRDVKDPGGWFRRSRTVPTPAEIYVAGGVRFSRGPGTGAASATLQGVRQAMAEGARSIFLHMDDSVYNDVFPRLLLHAADALERDPDLIYVRTGGYPLLSEWTKPRLGNRSLVHIEGDSIRFDGMELRPTRRPEYTLWSTPLTPRANEGHLWPMPLYHALFPARTLERILVRGIERGHRTLGEVETDYKDPAVWKESLAFIQGGFGYINFQYGGLEIHRTKIWKKIHRYVNDPIL